MSADFLSVAAVMSPADAARAHASLAADERTWHDNRYVEIDLDSLLALGVPVDDPQLSSRTGVFVALDRVGAPGWLLGGHAVRRVGAAELSALDAALGSLPRGWQAQVRAACGSGLPVDPDDALRALRDAVETASGAGHEVLVVVFPA